MSVSRVRSAALWLALGFVAVVVALAGIDWGMNLAGFSIDDPTDDSYYAAVSFLNNTATPVEIFTCGNGGGECHSQGSLESKTSMEQEVLFGPQMNLFQVRQRGQPNRWLVLSLPRHTEGSIYWIGDATASKTTISIDHGDPRLKPLPPQ